MPIWLFSQENLVALYYKFIFILFVYLTWTIACSHFLHVPYHKKLNFSAFLDYFHFKLRLFYKVSKMKTWQVVIDRVYSGTQKAGIPF